MERVISLARMHWEHERAIRSAGLRPGAVRIVPTNMAPGRRPALRFVALLAVALSLAGVLGGCVSKSKAEAQARMAYLAGQQQAALQWQQASQGTGVMFVGPVNQPLVNWSEGLTLGRAIVNAGYYAAADPRNIVIRRNGQAIQFDPKRLLQGEDFPLQPGDIVELQP
jgi:hypothetical protein